MAKWIVKNSVQPGTPSNIHRGLFIIATVAWLLHIVENSKAFAYVTKWERYTDKLD